MKNILFETKEDYLKFKENWANYFNTEARNLETDCYGYKERKLTASHFVLYAIIRGKDWESCLQNCSENTLNEVTGNLKSAWFYQTRLFNKVFDITDEDIDMIKEAARNFPGLEEVSTEQAIAQ
jgi:hypothetical protein